MALTDVGGGSDAAGVEFRVRYDGMGQEIAANTDATVDYDTVDFDAASGWDTSANQFTVPETGVYRFSASVGFNANTFGTEMQVQISLAVNGTVIAETRHAADDTTLALAESVEAIQQLSSGDTVEVYARHTDSDTIYTSNGGGYITRFSGMRLK